MGLNTMFGGPLGAGIATATGVLSALNLGKKIPPAPQLKERIPRTPWDPRQLPGAGRPGGIGPMTPQQAQQALASQFGGSQFPGQTGAHVQDAYERFRGQSVQREQDLGAAQMFRDTWRGNVGAGARATRSDWARSKQAGEMGLQDARGGLDAARAAADEARANTRADTERLMKENRQYMDQTLNEMRSMKADTMAAAKDHTANLLADYAAAVDMNTRARVEDAVAEARAMGLPNVSQVAIAAQIRDQGARALGDQLGKMSVERAYQLDNISVQTDQYVAGIQSTLAQANAGLTQAAIQELGTSERAWAQQQLALADARRMLETDANNWRSSMNYNLAWSEANIREATMRGAAIEAEMWKMVTVPILEMGYIADGLLGYDLSEIQLQFAFDQAEFANEMNVTDFFMDQVWQGFNAFANYNQQRMQRDAARDAARAQMTAGIASGVGAVGGGLAGGIPWGQAAGALSSGVTMGGWTGAI